VLAAVELVEVVLGPPSLSVAVSTTRRNRVSSASTDTLMSGHVVTVEPGVYLPHEGGVRIEDTVIVTDRGCSPLTHAPKDLVVA